jgi:hypothetical protein
MELSEALRAIAVILGTFLPIIGLGLTAFIASATRGMLRWTSLVILPGLISLLCWWAIEPVWRDGNLLAAVIYIAFFVALIAYYPILMVMGWLAFSRSRQ